MEDYEFDRARAAFFGTFQPVIRHELMYSADNTGTGTAAVTGDPTKIWVKDRAGNLLRISAGQLNPSMPAGVPLQVGATLGYSSQTPEAKAVFQEQYSAPTGALYNAGWVGANRSIAYAGSNGQIKGNANIFAFFDSHSQILVQGDQSSWTMDTYNNSATVGSFFGAHVAEGTYNVSTGVASPAAVTAGHLLMYFGVRVYGTSAFSTSYNARLKFTSTENATNTAHGTKAAIEINLLGAAAGSDALTLDDNGLTTTYGLVTPPTSVADTNYNALSTDYIIAYTSLSAGRTVNLPAVAGVLDGKRYTVKDEAGTAAANNITLDGNGAEPIDGAATLVISTNYGKASIYKHGSGWFTI